MQSLTNNSMILALATRVHHHPKRRSGGWYCSGSPRVWTPVSLPISPTRPSPCH